MNNYLNFTNVDEISVSVVELEKNPLCIVCSRSAVSIEVTPNFTLEALIEKLTEK